MKDRAIGFKGLAIMLSDVDSLVHVARWMASQSSGNAAVSSLPSEVVSTTHSSSHPTGQKQPNDRSPRPFVRMFVTGVGIVFVLVFLYSIYQNTPQPRASRPVSPAAGKPTPPSDFSQEFTEDMPPVGSDRILTSAQLKYCLAEAIRLDAASLQVQETDDKYDVFRYDGMIADYNRRCSHNRYHHDTYEAAQRAVELQRARLEAEGAKRFHNSSDPVTPNLETGPRERSRIIR